MELIGERQFELLRALTKHAVDFVVVGGVGAQIHGWRGATLDLDIALSSDGDNVDRLNAALESVGAGEGSIGAFGTSFMTEYGRLEIVRRADGVGGYENWLERAQPHGVRDLVIVVADPEDILRSKEAAGRDKDLAALPAMRLDFERAGATGG